MLLFSGKRFQTFNLHQLLHLKNNVENLGPLWSNSCFPFEDYNGDLKGYFHGSQNIQGQVRKNGHYFVLLNFMFVLLYATLEIRPETYQLRSGNSNRCTLLQSTVIEEGQWSVHCIYYKLKFLILELHVPVVFRYIFILILDLWRFSFFSYCL